MNLVETLFNEAPSTDRGMASALIIAGIPKPQAFKIANDAVKFLAKLWVDKTESFIDDFVNGNPGWSIGKLMAKTNNLSMADILKANPALGKKIINYRSTGDFVLSAK